MRLLICGDRNYSDKEAIRQVIEKFKPSVIIEGEAKGADSLAREVGEELGIEVEKYPADWAAYGRAAGPIRNSKMLKAGKPDIVVGFHDNISESKGTKNMLSISLIAGKPVFVCENRKMRKFENGSPR